MSLETIVLKVVVLFCTVGFCALIVTFVVWTIEGVMDLKERIENNRRRKR